MKGLGNLKLILEIKTLSMKISLYANHATTGISFVPQSSMAETMHLTQ